MTPDWMVVRTNSSKTNPGWLLSDEEVKVEERNQVEDGSVELFSDVKNLYLMFYKKK